MVKYLYLIQICFAFPANRQHFKALWKKERGGGIEGGLLDT